LEESLLDTSELIALHRSGQLEIQAYTTIVNLIEFPKAEEFEHLKVLYPTAEDYDNALVWSTKLLEKGKPVPAVDLVVCAVSARMSLQLVTRDLHFKEIKAVAKDLRLQTKSGLS